LIEVERPLHQLPREVEFVVLNGLDPCSGQTHAPEFQRSAADGSLWRIPPFPTSDDTQNKNLAAMQRQWRGEIRKHLVLTVRKGARNQQEGAENDTHGNNLASAPERYGRLRNLRMRRKV
jgi:hypothetical protein